MKNIKKIGALLLALVMVLSLSATALAAESLSGGKAGENYSSDNEGQKIDNAVTFNKELVIFNTTDSTTVYNPNITYSYTIVPATITSGTYVKDGDNDQQIVEAGVAAALKTTDSNYDLSAEFTSAGTTSAGTKGAIATDAITIVFDPDQFGHAGIFRYLITESDSASARTAAGIARKGTDTTRYLDVYVRVDSTDDDGDSSSTDFVIYGYVLSKANDSRNEKNGTVNPDDDLGLTTKTSGFLADYDNATGVVTTGDYYNTYNLKVVKKVAGTLADTNEKFPFGIAFLNSTITAQPKVGVDATHQSGTYAATVEEFTAGGALNIGTGAADSTLKLKSNDYIVITGIPAEITSSVTEYNSSYDIYKADITTTAVSGGTATLTDGPVTINRTQTATVTAVTGTNEDDTNAITAGDLVLTITNTIAVVSPTGVVMRVAPFALILVGGIFLLILARRRREEAEEA